MADSEVLSATIIGIEARVVQVQTQLLSGLRRFAVVGLPDGVLREAKDRVRCALEHSGFEFPRAEVIVNLAPAALQKRGAGFDLAIALSILAAVGELPVGSVAGVMAFAELNLDGSLKPVGGELAVAQHAARRATNSLFVSPLGAAASRVTEGLAIYGAPHLAEIVAHLRGMKQLTPVKRRDEHAAAVEPCSRAVPVLSDVVGQEQAKRALEITAAGGHNLLMVGPPGAGKSMLAERLPRLLPPLSLEDALEVASIQSVSNERVSALTPISSVPPFRAPHHATSLAGLIGGGTIPTPGEITLAHRGVLFLDEIAELRRDALEALRMPLETKTISISRSQMRLRFPADCIVVAAMNPCPCGKFGNGTKQCRCVESVRRKDFSRLSGPIRDRFDLQIWVPPVSILELQHAKSDGSEDAVRCERVRVARERQQERGSLNARLQGEQLSDCTPLDIQCKALIERAVERYSLSARGFTRVLRVARSIADLESCDNITLNHLAEALSFRDTLPAGL